MGFIEYRIYHIIDTNTYLEWPHLSVRKCPKLPYGLYLPFIRVNHVESDVTIKLHQTVRPGVQHLPHFFRHRAIIKTVKISIKESSELIDLQPPAVSLPSLHVRLTCKTVSSYANYINIFQLVKISPTSFFIFCQQRANGWTLRSGGVIIDKNYIMNNIQCISFLRS